MASINKCLKWVFIVFNTLFALIGIGLAVMAKRSMVTTMSEETENVWTVVVFGGLMAGISLLGIFGAYKEKKWALISFCVLVSIGMGICLIGGVNTTIARNLMSRQLENLKSDGQYVQQLQEQYNLECCGTDNGYQDWDSQVPDSCVCPDVHLGTPKCKRVAGSGGYDEYLGIMTNAYVEVYSEPCVPYFMRVFNMIMDASAGILFGLAIVAFIGVIMAIFMTCQTKKQRTTTPVPIFDYSKPPAYEELFNDKPEHV